MRGIRNGRIRKKIKRSVGVQLTIDGTASTTASPLYTVPFVVTASTTVQVAELAAPESAVSSAICTATSLFLSDLRHGPLSKNYLPRKMELFNLLLTTPQRPRRLMLSVGYRLGRPQRFRASAGAVCFNATDTIDARNGAAYEAVASFRIVCRSANAVLYRPNSLSNVPYGVVTSAIAACLAAHHRRVWSLACGHVALMRRRCWPNGSASGAGRAFKDVFMPA